MVALAHEGVLEKIPMSFSGLLKGRRELKGLSQKDLAEMTGISLSSIKQYEREKGSQPTLEKAVLLANALDTDMRDFFREVMEPGSVTGALSDPKKPRNAPSDLLRQDEFEDDLTEQEQFELDGRVLLDRIHEMVRTRGVGNRFLPKLLQEANGLMSEFDEVTLRDIAASFAIKLSSYPRLPKRKNVTSEMTGELCDALQERVLTEVIYGKSFAKLTVEQLRELHRLVARALGREWPLPGVPTRAILQDIILGPEKKEALRQGLLIALSKYLVEAATKGRAIAFFSPDEDGTVVFNPRVVMK